MQTDPHPDAAPPRPGASGVHAAIKRTPAPVLASDALREDLAPIEPGRSASRLWDACLAAGFLVVGICLKLGLGVTGASPDAASVCLAAAAATGATAVVPFPYLWRALVGALVGLVVTIIGLQGGGPLALLALPGVSSRLSESLRVLAAVAIPAALLFRAHYRAYRRGRVILAVAFAVALPFLVQQGMVVAGSDALLGRVGSTVAICAVLCSLFAFLDAPTTSAIAWWGGLVTGAIAFDVGLRQFYVGPGAPGGVVAHVLTAAAFITSVSPMALGLFQILAAVYAKDARRIDVHQASEA